MTMLFLELALMLAIILIASELFTNALEHLGERLGISEGVTGSLFAAVGTALPETTVPIIALLGGTPNRAINEEIGVGAILGAPLMLATLSTCLMTVAILKSRGYDVDYAPGVVLAQVAAIVSDGGWLQGGSDGRSSMGKAAGY